MTERLPSPRRPNARSVIPLIKPGSAVQTNGTTSTFGNFVQDVTVDPTNGKIYGTDTLNNRVLRFLPNGDFDTVFATGIFQAFGIAVDPAGNVYVAEDSPGRVHVFTSAGVPITTFDGGVPNLRPRYIDIDSQGRVIVTAQSSSGTSVFNGVLIFVDVGVPPVVNAGNDATIIQGFTFTQGGSFTDAVGASFTGTVNYGDGTGTQTLTLNEDKTFALSHTYASLGTFTVTVEISDGGGTGSDTLEVTVVAPPDLLPPVLTVPADISQEGNTTGGANVTVPPATATDDVDPAPTVSCDGGSGFFPVGETTVTCTATDASGKSSAPGSFTVTVVDTTPPTVTVPGTAELRTIEFEGAPAGRFTTYEEDGLTFTNPIEFLAAGLVDIEPDGDLELANFDFISITVADGSGSATFDVVSVDVDQTTDIIDISGVQLGGLTGTQPVGLSGVTSLFIVMGFSQGAIDNLVISIEGAPFPDITVDATVPGGAIVEFASFGSDIVDPTPTVTCGPLASGSLFPVGDTLVTCTATDASGNISTPGSFTVTVIGTANLDPVVGADQTPVTFDEGQAAANSGTVSDPDGDAVTLTASAGIVTNNGDGTWSWSFATSDGPAESQTVTISADDGNGGTASVDFALGVNNVAPTVGPVLVPTDPVSIGDQPVSASAAFSDPAGTADAPFSCTVDYGDGVGPQDGTVLGTTCTGPDQTYAGPGVYAVTIAVTDKDGGTGNATAAQFIVIYDPDGGFVTGGGWIDSPPGAYNADPSLTGKANFGFVSKYKKGATVPTGQTQFRFKAGDLNFHSSSYEWLVIAGARAQFKGVGTVNGTGNYRFILTATDGAQPGGGGSDKFRIKIVNLDNGGGIVYDNQPGAGQGDDPTTVLGGGSIVIHNP